MAHSINTWKDSLLYAFKDKHINNIIEWHGGDCPVPIGTKIAMEYRGCWCLSVGLVNGTENWQHSGDDMDIVAYQILKEKTSE